MEFFRKKETVKETFFITYNKGNILNERMIFMKKGLVVTALTVALSLGSLVSLTTKPVSAAEMNSSRFSNALVQTYVSLDDGRLGTVLPHWSKTIGHSAIVSFQGFNGTDTMQSWQQELATVQDVIVEANLTRSPATSQTDLETTVQLSKQDFLDFLQGKHQLQVADTSLKDEYVAPGTQKVFHYEGLLKVSYQKDGIMKSETVLLPSSEISFLKFASMKRGE